MQVFTSIKQLEEHVFINKLSESDYQYCVIQLPKGTNPTSYAIVFDNDLFPNREIVQLQEITVQKSIASLTEVTITGCVRPRSK